MAPTETDPMRPPQRQIGEDVNPDNRSQESDSNKSLRFLKTKEKNNNNCCWFTQDTIVTQAKFLTRFRTSGRVGHRVKVMGNRKRKTAC